MEQANRTDQTIRFGAFDVDPRSGELRKSGTRIRLQEQPFKVLLALLERPGEVVSRDELRRRIWPEESFGDFDHAVSVAVGKLRTALGDSAEIPRYVETLHRRGYRFVFPISVPVGQEAVETLPRRGYRFIGAINEPPALTPQKGTSAGWEIKERWVFRARWRGIVTTLVAIAIIAGGLYLYFHRAPVLREKDTIVLADFSNTTGDSVFDGTLRLGLSVQLEQSPFLSVMSGDRIRETLRMMEQPANVRLTPEITREVCLRSGSAAALNGSIALIGTRYNLVLRAVKCSNGDTLASAQAQANDKSKVLDALGKVASEIRWKLGESLSTLQKFDIPLEQATTPSLEALQAYTLGVKAMGKQDFAGAVPFFQRAITLDPNFASAFVWLATDYFSLNETGLAAENIRKAYSLRDRLGEHGKLSIEADYYLLGTGNLEKARKAYEVWTQTYPQDSGPRTNLGNIYAMFGQYDHALGEFREASRLDPRDPFRYAALVCTYLYLNRLVEARTTAKEAQAKKLDTSELRFYTYQLAFVQNDASGMAQDVAWAAGKPGVEDTLTALEADTAAYVGWLAKARELSRQAMASAERVEEEEAAASYEASAALREALFGNAAESHALASAALTRSTGRDVQYGAALALALAGNAAKAQKLADDFAMRFPEDTIVQFSYLPTLSAALALVHNNSSKAIQSLQAALPYELGSPFLFPLYPVYMRGKAYLAADKGSEAVTEFGKIIEHRQIVINEPIGALAHLELGRAYSLQGDTAKAKAAYQDFLTLWKDADPDIPVLKQAKAEYAKLI